MRKEKCVFYGLLLILVSSTSLLSSQGIEIESGASIDITGTASIEINNGSLINSGTYTKGDEILKFSGDESGELIASNTTQINELWVSNTGGIKIEAGTSTAVDIDDVFVDKSSLLTVESGDYIGVSGAITLEADETSSAEFFNNVDSRFDNIDQECFFKGGEWTFFSPPVDMLASDVFPDMTLATEGLSDPNADYWLVEYSQSSRASDGSGMKDISDNATQLHRGQGYMVWVYNDIVEKYSYTSSDEANLLDVSVSNTQELTESGWNLVGNPFTYTFSYDNVFDCAANVSDFMGAVYVWDDGGYKEWVSGLGDVEASSIRPLQAFFVKMDRPESPSGDESYTNFCMDRGSCDCASVALKSDHVSYGASSDVDALTITVMADGQRDKTYLRVHGDATLGFDKRWDAQKFELTSRSRPIIYSKDDDGFEYGINSIPISGNNTEEVPLMITLPSTDNAVQLTFDIQGNEAYDYTLYDKQTKTLSPIVNGQTIVVDTDGEATINDRFFIQFANTYATAIPEASDAEVKTFADVYRDSKSLFVNAYDDNVYVGVYDITGRAVLEQPLYKDETVSLDLGADFYLVKMTKGREVFVQKVVVK